MQNFLMKYCRISSGTLPYKVAQELGIDVSTYLAIERGTILITPEQAKQLGKFYNLKPNYIYQEALQTDLSLTNITIIKILHYTTHELELQLGRENK